MVLDVFGYLNRWLAERKRLGIESEWLFPAKPNPNEQIGIATVNSWANTFTRMSGKDFYAHSIRHYFTTSLARAGMPDGVIQSIVAWESSDSDYCSISTVEGNVPNVTFDFSYFDSRKSLLDYYPAEFKTKYNIYQKNRTTRWIELDSPTSWAIKCNSDILDYAIPPFAGILREIYEIEDYKQLRITKTALENYATVFMTLGIDKEGNWQMDLDKAKEFWRNLDSVLPDEIGSVLTPMPIDKISFEKSHTSDPNTVADAEEELFSAAGVSSLLFNNDKASANALALSIKADQAITYGIVKSIEDTLSPAFHKWRCLASK